MKIILIENSKLQYDGNSRNDSKLRGAELAIINYAEELSKRGYAVQVLNNCINDKLINKVQYTNLYKNNKKLNCEIAIVSADAKLLDYVNSNKKFLLSHSIQNLEKFLRNRQLSAFFKHKPKILCFSKYHFNNRSFFTSIYGKEIIIPSIDNDFFEVNLENEINKNVIFYSRGDRNGSIVIDVWKKIFGKLSIKQKLYIAPDIKINSNEMLEFNIFKREYMDKKNLINFLKKFRLLIIPGHKGEVFCNVAEEAKALCIPIVTLGIGALNERVENNYNGFICKNLKEFEEKITTLLLDDNIYLKFKKNLIKDRGNHKWSNTVDQLIKLF